MAWQCSGCAEKHEDVFDTCWNCGHDREGDRAEAFSRATDPPQEERLFDALMDHANVLTTTTKDKQKQASQKAVADRFRAYDERLADLESEVRTLRAEVRALRDKGPATGR